MELINLTGKTITIHITGKRPVVVEPAGAVARAELRGAPSRETPLLDLDGVRGDVHDITGLPEPQTGVYYLVTGIVREAARHRPDLVSPGPSMKGFTGAIVGCRGLITNI